MAWIVQDSAGTQIERRADPYLTDAQKKKYEKDLMPRYATRQACLLPICHDVLHKHGYLPPQFLEEVADFLGLSAAEVLDTVSFYEEFHLKPTGRYLIQVCRSISCELCGQRDLSDRVTEKLGIQPGETTEDGKFTLFELECLGSCGTAPVALINEDLHEDLTWEALEKLIDELPD
ncbi:MAG: NADH-quinone oxidoreductase subunit NuoE family protein [Planctomycetota bacterium]|jgi:NADH-quinone oxidoreductase subunit E